MNDNLDEDPTPQSLAIHSMTQGEEDDDLSGNDPDRSQFGISASASGMEIDTPLKIGGPRTPLRQRLLEQQLVVNQVDPLFHPPNFVRDLRSWAKPSCEIGEQSSTISFHVIFQR